MYQTRAFLSRRFQRDHPHPHRQRQAARVAVQPLTRARARRLARGLPDDLRRRWDARDRDDGGLPGASGDHAETMALAQDVAEATGRDVDVIAATIRRGRWPSLWPWIAAGAAVIGAIAATGWG